MIFTPKQFQHTGQYNSQYSVSGSGRSASSTEQRTPQTPTNSNAKTRSAREGINYPCKPQSTSCLPYSVPLLSSFREKQTSKVAIAMERSSTPPSNYHIYMLHLPNVIILEAAERAPNARLREHSSREKKRGGGGFATLRFYKR